MNAMAIASAISPSAPETTAAASSSQISGLASWRSSILARDGRGARWISLAPTASSSCRASVALSPNAREGASVAAGGGMASAPEPARSLVLWGRGAVVGVAAHAPLRQPAVLGGDAIRIQIARRGRQRARAGPKLVLAHEELLRQRRVQLRRVPRDWPAQVGVGGDRVRLLRDARVVEEHD